MLGTHASKSAAPAALGVDAEAFANLPTKLDFAERQSMAIEEFRHLVGRSQGFLLGAALIDGLRAQRLNALNDPREIFVASFGAGAGRREKQPAEIIEQVAHLAGEHFFGDARDRWLRPRDRAARRLRRKPATARRCMVSIWIDASRE